MKRLILLLLISVACYAQATWQVCVVRTEAAVPKQQCVVLGPALATSLQALIADSKAGDQLLYAGIGSLIVTHLRDTLFVPTLEKYPSPALKKLRDAAEVAASNAAKAAQAAVPAVPDKDP